MVIRETRGTYFNCVASSATNWSALPYLNMQMKLKEGHWRIRIVVPLSVLSENIQGLTGTPWIFKMIWWKKNHTFPPKGKLDILLKKFGFFFSFKMNFSVIVLSQRSQRKVVHILWNECLWSTNEMSFAYRDTIIIVGQIRMVGGWGGYTFE